MMVVYKHDAAAESFKGSEFVLRSFWEQVDTMGRDWEDMSQFRWKEELNIPDGELLDGSFRSISHS